MKYNRFRIFIVLTTFFAAWTGLLIRDTYIQVIPNQKLESLKTHQFSKMITLQPRRGIILDRNGKELAASISTFSVFADPSLIEDPRSISRDLARLLNLRPSFVRTLLKNLDKKPDKKFVWIKRNIMAAEKEKITQLDIRGIGFVQESKRIYPNNHLLAPVLGYVGAEGQGLEGLEAKYNDHLEGVKKQFEIQKDARGRPLIVDGRIFTEKPDGNTLTLTIDSDIQYNLEQELKDAMKKNEADGALGVILDVKTSEVLAMASIPGFDANQPGDFTSYEKRNRVITDPYEPGSTLKAFVIAAGLKEGILSANTKYFCENGKLKIGKRTIKEAMAKETYGWLTASEILAKSSNIGSAKIGFQLGDAKLLKVLKDFGFGEKTGIALGGESKGIIPSLPWQQLSLATIAFGQGIAVTPIQLATAYAAIANRGEYRKPTLIKSILDPETNEELELPKETARKVLTKDQADLMMYMLSSVTQQDGTAPTARIHGFPVAGKTGTAQKVDPQHGGYLKGAYISSFAGIVPAHSPQFVIYIAIDQPRKKYYANEVAAPSFAKMASYLVRKSGMSPVLLTQKDVMEVKNPQMEKAIEKVRKSLRDEAQVNFQNSNEYVVPDLKGLTLRELIEKMHGAPIEVKTVGTGEVYEVAPAIGTILTPGQVMKVYLK